MKADPFKSQSEIYDQNGSVNLSFFNTERGMAIEKLYYDFAGDRVLFYKLCN